jgi:hypothetical protein
MRYRRRTPPTVQAVQFDGQNHEALRTLLGEHAPLLTPLPAGALLGTDQGAQTLTPGDWLLLDEHDHPQVCRSATFSQTWEPVPAWHRAPA